MPTELFIDAEKKASLRMPSLVANFETAREALAYWHKLTPENRQHTEFVIEDGQRVYQPMEIPRIRFAGGPHA